VIGARQSVSVTFTSAQPAPKSNATGPTEVLGLPPLAGYLVLAGITLLILWGVLAAILLRNRGKANPVPTPSPPPPGAGGGPPAP
jgi:hypothetical protein